MDRRDLLKTAIAAGTLPVIAGCESRPEDVEPVQRTGVAAQPLVNEVWAREVLRREGFDGLVAMTAVNVFYLSNYTTFYRRMQVPHESFAVFPRSEKHASCLVASSADLWATRNQADAHPTDHRLQPAAELGALCGQSHLGYRASRDTGVWIDLAKKRGGANATRSYLDTCRCGNPPQHCTVVRLCAGTSAQRGRPRAWPNCSR